MITSRIVGTGSYVPEQIVTNEHALRVLKVIEACFESAKRQEVVTYKE